MQQFSGGLGFARTRIPLGCGTQGNKLQEAGRRAGLGRQPHPTDYTFYSHHHHHHHHHFDHHTFSVFKIKDKGLAQEMIGILSPKKICLDYRLGFHHICKHN